MTRYLLLPLAAVSSLALSACVPSANPNVYAPADSMQQAQVRDGTIVSARQVAIQNMPGNTDQTVGAVAGGVLGALAGDKLGKGTGNTLMTGLGAVAGATAGANVSQRMNRGTATQWIVQLENGSKIAVIQNDPSLHVGMAVEVLSSAGGSRIVAR